MKIQYGLIILVSLLGCTTPKSNDHLISYKDSLNQIQSTSRKPDLIDSLTYIGFVEKFEDTNMVYTDIYFVENFKHKNYDSIKTLSSETIHDQDETVRTILSLEKAGQYFNLTGLKTINIYNRGNRKIATGQLNHLEFIDDMIESRYVAVFEIDESSTTDYSFCIGNSDDDLQSLQYSSIEDEDLKSSLIKNLNLKTDYIWSVGHYKLNSLGPIYSTVSSDTTAYIIETFHNKSTVLYKSKSSEVIFNLTIISKEINGRPILLTSSGLPESDMNWSSVLTFNGLEYERSKNQRIKRE